MNRLPAKLPRLALLLLAPLPLVAQQAHTLKYAPGKSITLSLPSGFDIDIAATGLRRIRFFAQSPDGRIFATGMDNLSDNTHGTVYILDGWNQQTHAFTHVVHYLDNLHNPNNVAFYTEPAQNGQPGQSWIYIPLTDQLVRYKYSAGDTHPTSPPQVLTKYPDYGLNYKYGGWHLTRTVAVANLHGRTRVYVTAGSSCNYCREREAVRASLTAMDPDGTHQQILAHGLRNAVDLRFLPNLDGGALFATNMGDDHLGDQLPEDTFFELDANAHAGPIAAVKTGQPSTVNYGWPTCYFAHGQPVLDKTPLPDLPDATDARIDATRPSVQHKTASDSVYGVQKGVAAAGTNLAAQVRASTGPDLGPTPAPLTSCEHVPAAYTTFAAHGSPLGLAFFGADNVLLSNSFVVALHGASHPHIGTGYRIVRFSPQDRTPRDFVTGFLTFAQGKGIVHGRPCGVLRIGPDTFLVSDDYLGLVYYVHPQA